MISMVRKTISLIPVIFIAACGGGGGGSSTSVDDGGETGGTNQAPVAQSDTATAMLNVARTINVLANDSDPNNQDLSIAELDRSSLTDAQVSVNNNQISFTSTRTGEFRFSYKASDGELVSDWAEVVVNVQATQPPVEPNEAPIARDDVATAGLNVAQMINVLSNDSDPNDHPISITEVDSSQLTDAQALINNNQISFTGSRLGEFQFSYRISDGELESDWAQVVVTVEADQPPVEPNEAPIARDDAATARLNVPTTINVLTNDSDPNRHPLSIAEVDRSQLTDAQVVINNNQITFTGSRAGEFQFSYRASDGELESDWAQVIVTIEAEQPPVEPNQAPIALDDAATGRLNVPIPINVLANDTDPNEHPLSIAEVDRSQLTDAQVVINNNQITFTSSRAGEFQFSYKASDGELESDWAQVVVNVEADQPPVENQPPVARDDTATVDLDVATVINVLANDSDPNEHPLRISDIDSSQITNGRVALSDNQITFTGRRDGEYRFRYKISDGELESDWAQVVVDVEGPNSPPVARDDTVTTLVNTPIEVDVLANDWDNDEDELVITAVANTVNGLAEIENNQVVFTPATDFVGEASVQYTITDSEEIATAKLTVTVVSDTLALEDDTASTLVDQAVTVNVLSNDGGSVDNPITLSSVGTPENGQAVIQDGQIVYTPRTGFIGTDTFTYQAESEIGATGEAQVTVQVRVNSTPIARNDYISRPFTAEAISLGPLQNDTDVDGDTLEVISIDTSRTTGGVLLQGASVLYTPTEGFIGKDTVSYTIEDVHGARASASITFNIHEPVTLIRQMDLPATQANQDLVTNINNIDIQDEGKVRRLAPAGDVDGDGHEDLMIYVEDAVSVGGSRVSDDRMYIVAGQETPLRQTLPLDEWLAEGIENGFIFGYRQNEIEDEKAHFGVNLNNAGSTDVAIQFLLSIGIRFDALAAAESAVDLNGSLTTFSLPQNVEGTIRYIYGSHVFDINNDGIDDLIVGVDAYYRDDRDAVIDPEVKVMFGPFTEDGPNPFTLPADGVNGFNIKGFPLQFDVIIDSAMHSGDLNNDGIDDLIIGLLDPRTEVGGPFESALYVIWGGQDFDGEINVQEFTAADYRKNEGILLSWDDGANSGKNPLGKNVYVMDINADGKNDLILDKESTGLGNANAVGVVFGQEEWPNTFDIGDLPEDGSLGFEVFEFDELLSRRDFFFDVDAGDINADGYADLALRAGGGVTVLLGTPSVKPVNVDLGSVTTTPLVKIRGRGLALTSSTEVTILDMNNDGFDDIVIGGRNEEVFIVYGGPHFNF